MGDDELSGLELKVLLTIAGLGSEAYGIPIQDRIRERGGRKVALGSVYACLERLQKKGFIKGRDGSPLAQRGGRSRRFFSATGAGRRAQMTNLRSIDGLRPNLTEGGEARA